MTSDPATFLIIVLTDVTDLRLLNSPYHSHQSAPWPILVTILIILPPIQIFVWRHNHELEFCHWEKMFRLQSYSKVWSLVLKPETTQTELFCNAKFNEDLVSNIGFVKRYHHWSSWGRWRHPKPILWLYYPNTCYFMD